MMLRLELAVATFGNPPINIMLMQHASTYHVGITKLEF